MNARPHIAAEKRLFSREEAAAYCGLSIPTFLSVTPVIPIKIRTRILYDRVRLDAWIDSMNKPAPNAPTGAEWLGLLDHADGNQGH